jgi:hypothetical protein
MQVPLEMEALEEKAARPAHAPTARTGASAAAAAAAASLDGLEYSPRGARTGAGGGKAGRRVLEGEEEELLRRLHGVREKLAGREGVALSLVCQDGVLYELATRRPSTLAGLADIDGASRALVERHGEALVQAVVAFCSQPFVSLKLDGWQESKRGRPGGPGEALDGPQGEAGGGKAPGRSLPVWLTAGRSAGAESLRSVLQRGASGRQVAGAAPPARAAGEEEWTEVGRRQPGPGPGHGPDLGPGASPGASPRGMLSPAAAAAAARYGGGDADRALGGGAAAPARRWPAAGGGDNGDAPLEGPAAAAAAGQGGWGEGGALWDAMEAVAAGGGVRSRIADGGAAVAEAMVRGLEGRGTRGQVVDDSDAVLTDSDDVLTDSDDVLTDSDDVLTDSDDVLTDSDDVLTDSDDVLTDSDGVHSLVLVSSVAVSIR